MMLRAKAIQQFLDRPLQDCRSIKKLGARALRERREVLPLRPPIWSRLHLHQRACLLLGIEFKRFAFLLDTGMGKTFLSVALARYFHGVGEVKRVLVLVPNKINKWEWQRDVRKLSPATTLTVLSGSSKNKWEQLRASDSLLTVETYPGLVRMVTELTAGKRGRRRLRPDKASVRELVGLFDGLVMDESTSVKNHRSLPYRICWQLSRTCKIVYALTGTPFGRDPLDLWAQLHLVDRGETLGPTLGLFRAAFFNGKKNFWGGFEYTFDRSKREQLHRMLAHRSIRYVAKEGDLPKLVAIVKEVRLPHDTDEIYRQVKEALIAAKGNYIESKNAFLRMRQISSGFLGYKGEEDGARAEYEFKVNPKLEQLLALIQSIPPERKVIVYHDFIFSGDMIARELTRLGIGHCRVYGKTKDAEAELRRFNEDPQVQVFVLNNSSGGFGLNLQIAQYGIYYESPLSAIVRKQTRRRFERQGSKHGTVFQYDLVVRHTVDQAILRFHAQGKNLFESIIEGKVPLALL